MPDGGAPGPGGTQGASQRAGGAGAPGALARELRRRAGAAGGAGPGPPTTTGTTGAGPVQPRPATAAAAAAAGRVRQGANQIWVSERQRGNGLLRHLRHVRWGYAAELVPDYQVGQAACALYLSLRYHLLKPEYIGFRALQLPGAFRLRVLLCLVDVDDPVRPLGEVTKLAVRENLTLLCAWSHEEAARYLETLKSYEHKPADALRERVEADYLSRLTAALTQVRGVNKTDVLTLSAKFSTLGDAFQASAEDLAVCRGLGPTKVRRLHDAFHKPFQTPAAALVAQAARAEARPTPARDQPPPESRPRPKQRPPKPSFWGQGQRPPEPPPSAPAGSDPFPFL